MYRHLLLDVKDPYVTLMYLNQLCQKLKDNKAPVPESIHSYILKACAHTLCTPLTNLFQQSLTSGALPSEWKKVHVIPVF